MAKNKSALIEKPAPVEDAGDVIAQAVTPAPEVCGHKSGPFTCSRYPHNVGPHRHEEDGRVCATWN